MHVQTVHTPALFSAHTRAREASCIHTAMNPGLDYLMHSFGGKISTFFSFGESQPLSSRLLLVFILVTSQKASTIYDIITSWGYGQGVREGLFCQEHTSWSCDLQHT